MSEELKDTDVDQSVSGGGSVKAAATSSAANAEPSAALPGLNEEKLGELNELAEELRKAEGVRREARAWIAKKLDMSLATFDRKAKGVRCEGIKFLVRKPRSDKGRPRVADEKVVARIQAEYLKLHRPTAQAVYEKIKKDFSLSGLPAPSYSWVLRQIERIPADMISRHRIGEKHYRDNFEYSSTRRRPERPREWVDADHHEADHYVLFPDGTVGRPFLTAAHDLCTGEILALRIPRDKRVGRGRAPGAYDIGLAIRQAILKKDFTTKGTKDTKGEWPSFGLFDHLYHDLGKDFLSSYLRAVCADLHIKPVPCRGYHGQSKPIERWFRTLEDGTRELPGYCGSKPENNPYRAGIRPQEIDPKTLMELGQYEAACIEWVVKEYHHRGQAPLGGASPLEALEAHVKSGWRPREVRDERALDLLLMRRARRSGGELIKVRKDGFRLFGRIYFHPALLDLIGQEIEPRYDDGNLGEIVCYHNDRFVCTATNKELMRFDATTEMLERANEIKRGQRRRLQERYEEMIKAAQYPDPLARAAAETRYEEVLEEEREKIAVGAEAEGVPVLLPKYAQAAKRLEARGERREARGKRQELREVKREQTPSRLTPPASRLPEEELPTAEEIFKREENPWIEKEEENG